MNCSTMRPETHWKNIGRAAARLGWPLEKALTGRESIDLIIAKGYALGVRKYGQLCPADPSGISAPVIPGLTSWTAWSPIGKPNRERWFSCIRQAWATLPAEMFGAEHQQLANTLWVQGLEKEGWKLLKTEAGAVEKSQPERGPAPGEAKP